MRRCRPNVVGAHAQGFNQGSVGVALIGTYDSASITPRGSRRAGPAPRLAPGRGARRSAFDFQLALDRKPEVPGGAAWITLRDDLGHRDTGSRAARAASSTASCPSIARAVSQTGLPEDVLPAATGAPGEPVHFHGQAHAVAAVVGDRDAAGREHRRLRARARARSVDWTWDARTIPAGKYLYAIDAGPTGSSGDRHRRPARRRVSMLTALASLALFTPNGDGKADSTLVRYQVREPAIVTGTVVDAFGTPITTLFVESKTRGSYAFRWDATGIADGRYWDRADGAERDRDRDDRHSNT